MVFMIISPLIFSGGYDRIDLSSLRDGLIECWYNFVRVASTLFFLGQKQMNPAPYGFPSGNTVLFAVIFQFSFDFCVQTDCIIDILRVFRFWPASSRRQIITSLFALRKL